MKILQCKGYELEKEKPNTSEEFFNRSEVTYLDNGQEKTLSVLYLRYFDENFQEFVTYKEEPLFQVGNRSVYFKEIVALCALLNVPEYRGKKRIYINSQGEFQALFKGIDYQLVEEVFHTLQSGSAFHLGESLKTSK